MLIVPPSIVCSPCWSSLLMGQGADGEPEAGLWGRRESSPSVGTTVGICNEKGVGRVASLSTNSDCWSKALKASWTESVVTEVCTLAATPRFVLKFLSSNFSVDPELGPFFTAGGCPRKLWTRQWLCLCSQITLLIN